MLKRYCLLVFFGFAIVFAGCSGDNNNPDPVMTDTRPTITSIHPTAVPRGTEHAEMTVTGTNLNGANAAVLGDGTTVFEVTATNATTVKIKFSIQRKATLGTRDVSVTTPKGTAIARGALRIDGDAPVAKYTTSPNGDVSRGSEVQFDGSPSFDNDGTIKHYLWDFGDGSKKAEGKIVTHKFKDSGSYNVALTVTDNDDQSSSEIKPLAVSEVVEVKCTQPASNHGFLGGTIVGVEGKYAIIQLAKDRTCANSFYMCGDMRLDDPEIFRGIIKEMYSLGGGKFKVLNDCPYRWPPQIGEYDVLIFKHCDVNFCPGR
jgi:PKD repeat protein